MSDFHFVTGTGASGGLAASAVADFVGSGAASDIVSMKQYHTVYFIVHQGVGAAGTHTLTVIPCDDVTPSNTTTAIPFQYKRVSAGETNTAWTAASTFTTAAGSHQMWIVKVKSDDLPLVSGVKYEYCKLDIADVDGTAVLGGCIIMMADPRINEATLDAVTA